MGNVSLRGWVFLSDYAESDQNLEFGQRIIYLACTVKKAKKTSGKDEENYIGCQELTTLACPGAGGSRTGLSVNTWMCPWLDYSADHGP